MIVSENEAISRLAVGAKVVADIRRKLFRDLNFTASAGISHNKMLSKLVVSLWSCWPMLKPVLLSLACLFQLSAQYKPNKQAVIPNTDAQRFMLSVPLRKIRRLGGKFGSSLEAAGLHSVEDVVKQPLSVLRKHFGEDIATWLYRLVRGIDSSPVVPRTLPKVAVAV
jgi:DNA polymerase eta